MLRYFGHPKPASSLIEEVTVTGNLVLLHKHRDCLTPDARKNSETTLAFTNRFRQQTEIQILNLTMIYATITTHHMRLSSFSTVRTNPAIT